MSLFDDSPEGSPAPDPVLMESSESPSCTTTVAQGMSFASQPLSPAQAAVNAAAAINAASSRIVVFMSVPPHGPHVLSAVRPIVRSSGFARGHPPNEEQVSEDALDVSFAN